ARGPPHARARRRLPLASSERSPDARRRRRAAARVARRPLGRQPLMARNTSFYYSFLVLPARQRRAIVTVWDWCRAVDDAVDQAPGGSSGRAAREAIRFWRAELDACYAGREPQTSQANALQPVIARFNLPRQPFDDVIDGVAMDID